MFHIILYYFGFVRVYHYNVKNGSNSKLLKSSQISGDKRKIHQIFVHFIHVVLIGDDFSKFISMFWTKMMQCATCIQCMPDYVSY